MESFEEFPGIRVMSFLCGWRETVSVCVGQWSCFDGV